ncbi:MAG: hypothetical protein AAFR84_06510 [Pseudomonadota bacterium]
MRKRPFETEARMRTAFADRGGLHVVGEELERPDFGTRCRNLGRWAAAQLLFWIFIGYLIGFGMPFGILTTKWLLG